MDRLQSLKVASQLIHPDHPRWREYGHANWSTRGSHPFALVNNGRKLTPFHRLKTDPPLPAVVITKRRR